MSYTPTTEEVRADYCLLADVSRPRQLQFDRWLDEVKREVWDEAVKQVIATVRCDSEDVTWVNKNPYRQGEGSGNDASQSPIESGNLLNGEEQ